MADTTFPGMVRSGTAASRPAASAVAKGTVYFATDTGVVSQSDTSSWTTLGTTSGSTAAPQFSTIELGHASDTTLARVSAGVVSIEGTNIVKAGAITSSGLTQATGKLLGRNTASTGAVEEITLGTNLSMTGTTLNAASGSGGTPVLRLDYALAADVTNQTISSGTPFDVFANQNFTVGSASSLIEIIVRGFGFFVDASSTQYMCRINVDSGGTPVLKYMSGSANNNATFDQRENVLAGGVVYISGLSAATHTIKVQVLTIATQHFYCRASTNGPTTGGEFLNVQVIEHP